MRIAVTLVGRQVRRMIERPCDGEVIAVFRRSLYVRDAGGAIACFGVPGLGAGPLNALCDSWPEEPLTAGLATSWSGTTLRIGRLWAFDMGAAELWQPPAGNRATILAEGLSLLAKIATHGVTARGLGRLISPLVGVGSWVPDDPFERAGAAAVHTLGDWLAAPMADPPPALERLLGLGPGLTPAGDDALGGALIATRAFGRADLADRLAAWLLPRAKSATSDISFAHLAAAAEGDGAEALHDTLAALARADGDALRAALRRLDAIGHSSGWDALAGATAALVALRG